MRVLVVGGDGRAHALAWSLARSHSVDEVVCAPGNPGTAAVAANVPVGVDDLEGLAALAVERSVDLTVVSPEAPLVAGITDVFARHKLRVFGPTGAAAEIEGSKVFCRDLARRLDVPVAAGESFDDPDAATDFAKTIAAPIVVKADGLAAGKGVLICEDHAAARRAVDSIMRERVFGESGSSVIVEEFLEGRETSIFCVTDGEAKVVLEPAQDYKRALDDDQGLNTGGMGSYTPVPWLDPEMRERALQQIVFPMIDGMRELGRRYVGCVYAGLMVTDKGPYLIEINCRFGDPEIQALLPRLSSDLGALLDSAVSGTLSGQSLEWRDDACVCVCTASGGYPESYETGKPISGIEEAEADDGVVVFQAGTKLEGGKLVSGGGRVLNVSALGENIPKAREAAYAAVEKVEMQGLHYRTDIAKGVS